MVSEKDKESNCTYPMLKTVGADATLGEIVKVGKDMSGEWKESLIL
jgi:methylmalonyl-CoA mutase N-terminal domain/subunit